MIGGGEPRELYTEVEMEESTVVTGVNGSGVGLS